MPGYFEMFVTMRDRENCYAMHLVEKFIVAHTEKPDFVFMVCDDLVRGDVEATIAVPDEHQFDRLLDALRAVSTTGDESLLSLVCYRNGRPNERALSDDEVSIEYFNPRPGHKGFMIHYTDSAVRLTHQSTGMVAISQASRSGPVNLQIASQMLNAKLAENPSPLFLSMRSIEGLKHYPFPTPMR